MSEAILIVDMVVDFVHGRLKTERAQWIIPSISKLSQEARKTGRPVVYIGDAHLPSDPELEVWGEHAMRGTPAARTIPELRPQMRDHVLEKRTYSAFYETGLDLLLRRLGVDSVVIAGLHTNICDRHTAADAFHRGYRIIVPRDCTQALTDEEHESGLAYLERIYGSRITTSEDLIGEWSAEEFEELKSESWDQLEQEIEAVHRGEVPEFRAVDMELVWKCTRCGSLYPRNKPAPEQCPKCGAPESEFVAVIED